MTPRVTVAPAAAVGAPVTVSAGHSVPHAPLHALVPAPVGSLSKTYRVRPDASTSTAPTDDDPSLSVAWAVWAGAAEVAGAAATTDDAELEWDADDPQAARTNAAP